MPYVDDYIDDTYQVKASFTQLREIICQLKQYLTNALVHTRLLKCDAMFYDSGYILFIDNNAIWHFITVSSWHEIDNDFIFNGEIFITSNDDDHVPENNSINLTASVLMIWPKIRIFFINKFSFITALDLCLELSQKILMV